MKKIGLLISLFLILLLMTQVRAQELRGTWMARSSFSSKAKIASQMDSLAAANFNVVYVNVWSRGYPLWQSEVFRQHTGISIDPAYTGRDILAEAIAEGHRVGLHVEAWFEYGFVAGYAPSGTTSKGPIFEAHPTWVARTQTGVEKDASNFYWMVHSNPEVQEFLVSLATEIAQKYDVDGIEMDRIRYSSKDYGYDPFTVDLYKKEHNGAEPPVNGADSAWMRWRADKLNQFVALLYDRLKAENPKVNVSSAPSQMGTSTYTAYENLLQDWKWWVNNDKVDNLQMQSYTSNISTYQNWLTYTKNAVSNYQSIYPSFAVNPGTTSLTPAEVVDYLNVNTSLGFKGAALWFYDDLVGKFNYLKNSRFATPMYPPYAAPDWREYKAITAVSNTQDAVRTGAWAESSMLGYQGKSLYGGLEGRVLLDYFVQVPANAWYEVYVYNVPASNRTTAAPYIVYDYTGAITTKTVNQTQPLLAGWNKLSDAYLTAGRRQVVQLTNDNVEAGKLVSADAVMIIRNRRLDASPAPGPLGIEDAVWQQKGGLGLYPNPSTGNFTITGLDQAKRVENIFLMDAAGKLIRQIQDKTPDAMGSLQVNLPGVRPGIYVLKVQQGAHLKTQKIAIR
ncbi:family 10 glycosylhydrolase [Nibribacter ruber]|uniref:Family 10 glycosylhydrolase n=1 Tax=Nibribacter ruber TaxID=2698458 RepID=A0A6P1NV33_9BACT|nr:family 10 glycosylhydrolase [Nibribacter ruber]QHL87597.1 family 10 glycosylhydrolase [Nibribacter ruber]